MANSEPKRIKLEVYRGSCNCLISFKLLQSTLLKRTSLGGEVSEVVLPTAAATHSGEQGSAVVWARAATMKAYTEQNC
jgi:hypothetical protein